ncbi:MAG TPA: hypothetical protein VIA06_25655 [Candidatus Dormibacteraeota bacterium]|jgi:hypothetical protein|nr:hypothetical protein [Candidatus Dormibacteraeota bacterium]
MTAPWSEPSLVIVTGIQAEGKTTIGRPLARGADLPGAVARFQGYFADTPRTELSLDSSEQIPGATADAVLCRGWTEGRGR